MFKSMKQLFKPTNRDLLKRIGFTILVLAIFIIGTTIQVPGTKSITKNLGFLELINSKNPKLLVRSLVPGTLIDIPNMNIIKAPRVK